MKLKKRKIRIFVLTSLLEQTYSVDWEKYYSYSFWSPCHVFDVVFAGINIFIARPAHCNQCALWQSNKAFEFSKTKQTKKKQNKEGKNVLTFDVIFSSQG